MHIILQFHRDPAFQKVLCFMSSEWVCLSCKGTDSSIDLPVPDQMHQKNKQGQKEMFKFQERYTNHAQLVKKVSLPQLYVYYHYTNYFNRGILLQGGTEVNFQGKRIICSLIYSCRKELSNYFVFGFWSLEDLSQGFCASLLLRMCSQDKPNKCRWGIPWAPKFVCVVKMRGEKLAKSSVFHPSCRPDSSGDLRLVPSKAFLKVFETFKQYNTSV